MTNFESLEKNSIDLYAATKSLYLKLGLKKLLIPQVLMMMMLGVI